MSIYDEQPPRKKKKDNPKRGPNRTPPVLGDPGPQPITQRRFKPKPVYKDRIMRIAEENDAERLNKIKDRVKDIIEGFTEGAGKKFVGAKRGGKMSTGGEVDIDMTTEMDV